MTQACPTRRSADLLQPKPAAARWEAREWLMAQVSWVGPMLCQHTYFRIQPSEAGSHAATRYRDQARRVFEVLYRHLSTRDWLAAGRNTIADLATYLWGGSRIGLGFGWND